MCLPCWTRARTHFLELGHGRAERFCASGSSVYAIQPCFVDTPCKKEDIESCFNLLFFFFCLFFFPPPFHPTTVWITQLPQPWARQVVSNPINPRCDGVLTGCCTSLDNITVRCRIMTPQNSLRQTVSISAFEIRSRFQPPFFARVTHALLSDRTVPS